MLSVVLSNVTLSITKKQQKKNKLQLILQKVLGTIHWETTCIVLYGADEASRCFYALNGFAYNLILLLLLLLLLYLFHISFHFIFFYHILITTTIFIIV